MWQAIVKWIGTIALYSFFLGGLQAQTDSVDLRPYHFSWSLDLPLSLSAVSTGVAYLILDAQTPVLTLEQLQQFDRSQVPVFDRSATYLWSTSTALASDVLLYSSCAMPLALLASPNIRKDYLKLGLLYAQTFALTAGLTALTKNLVKRPRPFVFNPLVDLSHKQKRSARYAFFSGHTSMSAALCFLTAQVFQDYHRGHKAVPWVWTAAAVVPAITGVLRHQAGKHYWSDIFTGYLIGAGIGLLLPKIHQWARKNKEKQLVFHF
jgi:membrane-associated phospholipid phosphatase